jgi:hypothetical protein
VNTRLFERGDLGIFGPFFEFGCEFINDFQWHLNQWTEDVGVVWIRDFSRIFSVWDDGF